VPGISSTAIRELVGAGDVEAAARLLGRPAEVEGNSRLRRCPWGDARLSDREPARRPGSARTRVRDLRGSAAGHRAAVSIGTNPHYGGSERRVEAFLLDFEGDLYGERLIVELWRRLREERAFASEDELVAQITRDVEATRAAERPV